ncbi:L-serine dehydratase 1 [Commensalibacter sp. Nvir]|uniref:L-serine ammonia-lyase n=1 Tax=Commensalibacter sp. Nvir TaxID=3069817 RepID=UPI002D75D99C|nr:L-serine dehydratase 1 [Commensalibacter sp. Nvir]
MESVFNIFKIGIGPSSSHTVGPMKASKQFIDELITKNLMPLVTTLVADVYGSLSLTGKGHQTDNAILAGLAGNEPENVEVSFIPKLVEKVKKTQRLSIYNGKYEVEFPFETNMVFHTTFLPLHENGMVLSAYSGNELILKKTYYSVGGGNVMTEEELVASRQKKEEKSENLSSVPYPFRSAEKLLEYCNEYSLSISSIMMANELTMHSQKDIETYFTRVQQIMKDRIDQGMMAEGTLPGPLKVPRRAATLRRQLMAQEKGEKLADPMLILDWINMFALAVCEENAAGGRVVTAPTNGACGIIPAVLAYYNRFIHSVNVELILRYFLTSGAIGLLYKMNASISGAEVGCQGEVGVACSMAAAGLADLFGGTPIQVCTAAEIAMEHNLGLTCDPVGGQVQIPCIERNAIASVKAINAARLAMRRNDGWKISLDAVIETMYETGKDMDKKYRETSKGGLARVYTMCH